MTGKTHVATAVASMSLLAVYNRSGFNIGPIEVNCLIALFATPIGAKLPDIDLATSSYGKKAGFLTNFFTHRGLTHTMIIPLLLLMLMYNSALILPEYTGIFVTILFFAGLGRFLAEYMLPREKKLQVLITIGGGMIGYAFTLAYAKYVPLILSSVLFGVLFGYLDHLKDDILNEKGIPLFWPVAKNHIHIASIRTSGPFEYVFLVLWLVGCGIFGIRGL